MYGPVKKWTEIWTKSIESMDQRKIWTVLNIGLEYVLTLSKVYTGLNKRLEYGVILSKVWTGEKYGLD